MSLCQFRDVLGKPRKGIHSLRIFNIAIVDLILTLCLAKFNQVFFQKLFPYPYWVWLVVTLFMAIILHRVFCVNTTINIALFGKV